MKYTTKHMQELFESINFDLFQDKLDMPTFFLLDQKLARKLWPDFQIDGLCIYKENKFEIGIQKGLQPKAFFDTLVHELIHVYLIEEYNYPGHGKKFKKMCEKAIDIYYPI